MNVTSLEQAYNQGREDFKKNVPLDKNPFCLKTQMFRFAEWRDGWFDAHDESEGLFHE